MASWHRVMVDKSSRFSLLYRRWYNSVGFGARTSTAIRSGWPVSSQAPEEAGGAPACMRDGAQYMATRSFAAPVQALKKEEPKGMQGPRLNEAITAKSIRLVTDEGHAVVSREEALDRARRLDLDLVEVQRTAKPPVCKIMDYHKEKYKKETTEKERVKTKSESTIRKGDFKEVRLKGKIEQKDIEVKAETVKGLIERGYRVKCMALPSKQRGTEEHDLGALLSRLTDLIEDVIVVESGPFVEKQQAYVVVRHVKFGSKKGSRKKPSKTVETTSATERAASTTRITCDGATIDAEAVEPIDIDEETEDEILSDPESDAQHLPSSATTSPSLLVSGTNSDVDGPSAWAAMVSEVTDFSSLRAKLVSERDQIRGRVSPRPSISQAEFSAEDSNRYSRRVETKFRPDQPAGRSGTVTEVTERVPTAKTLLSSLRAEPVSARDQIRGRVSPRPSISQSEFSAEDSNGYSRRVETKFRPDQPAGRSGTVTEVKRNPQYPGSSSFDDFQKKSIDETEKIRRWLDVANSRQTEQQRSNRGNIPRQSPAYENQRRDHLDLNQGQIPPPAPNYGIFSSPKPSTSGIRRMADVDGDNEKSTQSSDTTPNIPKSRVETTGEQRPDRTRRMGDIQQANFKP